ncbi:MAG: hypothetical protein V3S30_00940 [Thermoanaerobaculia bacterium]
MTVRPSGSVRKYQHGEYDLDAVRDELAVNFVLAGNCRSKEPKRLDIVIETGREESGGWAAHQPLRALVQVPRPDLSAAAAAPPPVEMTKNGAVPNGTSSREDKGCVDLLFLLE